MEGIDHDKPSLLEELVANKAKYKPIVLTANLLKRAVR